MFAGNTAERGGGLYTGNNDLTLAGCIFAGNLAHYGGAVYHRWGDVTIRNGLFSGNTANVSGGALHSEDNHPISLANCTISWNSALYGRAMGCSGGTQTRIEMTSCVIWNGGRELEQGCVPTITYSNVLGGWPGGNIFLPPEFVDADGADDIPGTADDDLRLLPDSPCVDSGNPDFVPEPDETDLDGNPRVVNGRVDMGAYENQYACSDADDCDDGDTCTDDACNAAEGCVHAPIECDAGYVCVDGSCEVVCELMDTDGDGDIDLRDHAVWQNCFSGPAP